GVRELVEHHDLVAVIAGADAGEVGADETGSAAHEELHAWTFRVARWAARPSCQGGSVGRSCRVEPSTEKAGRGAGRGNSALVQAATATGIPAGANVATARSYQEHCPAPVTCSTPWVRASAIVTSACARWPV